MVLRRAVRNAASHLLCSAFVGGGGVSGLIGREPGASSCSDPGLQRLMFE